MIREYLTSKYFFYIGRIDGDTFILNTGTTTIHRRVVIRNNGLTMRPVESQVVKQWASQDMRAYSCYSEYLLKGSLESQRGDTGLTTIFILMNFSISNIVYNAIPFQVKYARTQYPFAAFGKIFTLHKHEKIKETFLFSMCIISSKSHGSVILEFSIQTRTRHSLRFKNVCLKETKQIVESFNVYYEPIPAINRDYL